MKTKTSDLKKALYFIIPLVLIAFVVIKLRNNKEITQSKVYEYRKDQAIHVQADTIQLENIASELSFSGIFEPYKESKISTEIQGKINNVLVDAGSVVRKGQSVIQLDNSLLKLQLQAINVQIEGLDADVNRYNILLKADAIQGIQLEKAELGLKSTKLQKATLLEQIYKTTIKAPFNGIVTSKLSEEGAYAAPGIPLLQITDIANLKFTVNVPENDLNQFQLNQSYPITADAYPEISLYGKTTMIGSKANMGNSFPVQFAVNNTPSLKIKSGMFGKVILKNNTPGKGIVISSAAIMGTSHQPQVYLMKNGKATLQNITISNKIQNKTIVSGGLNAGDVIITNGFINLYDGANVIVKQISEK